MQISGLPVTTAIDNNAVFAVENNNVTNKTTFGSIVSNAIVCEVVNVSIPAYAAAPGGVRGGIVGTNITKAGYTPISATINTLLPGVNERIDVMIDTSGNSDMLRCITYHTYNVATTAMTLPVLVVYLRDN